MIAGNKKARPSVSHVRSRHTHTWKKEFRLQQVSICILVCIYRMQMPKQKNSGLCGSRERPGGKSKKATNCVKEEAKKLRDVFLRGENGEKKKEKATQYGCSNNLSLVCVGGLADSRSTRTSQ